MDYYNNIIFHRCQYVCFPIDSRSFKSRVALHVGQEDSTELESFFSLIGICSGYSSIIWYIRRRVIQFGKSHLYDRKEQHATQSFELDGCWIKKFRSLNILCYSLVCQSLTRGSLLAFQQAPLLSKEFLNLIDQNPPSSLVCERWIASAGDPFWIPSVIFKVYDLS